MTDRVERSRAYDARRRRGAEFQARRRAYCAKRRANPELRLGYLIEQAVYRCVSTGGRVRAQATERWVGCDAAYLVRYLRQTAPPGFKRWGPEWSLDHVIPRACFAPGDEAQQRLCWHWRNLRIVARAENVEKGDLLPDGTRGKAFRARGRGMTKGLWLRWLLNTV